MGVGSIQCCLAGEYISLGGIDPSRTLEDLPEQVQYEIYWNSHIRGNELVSLPWFENIEAIEQGYDGEEDEGEVGGKWLEW